MADGSGKPTAPTRSMTSSLMDSEWARTFRLEQARRRMSTAYRAKWSERRQRAAAAMENIYFESMMGGLLVFNVCVVIRESDMNAWCEDNRNRDCDMSTISGINTALLGVYMIELFLRIGIYRCDFLFSGWNIFDVLVISCSLFEEIATHTGNDVPTMQVLRVFRVLRLLRTTRIMKYFPELYLMVKGFASALAAMWWGFVLIIFSIVIWSIAAVEMVHPNNKIIDHGGDEYCEGAFRSVNQAAFFFFQTLVAGDGWGTCIIPITQEFPGLTVIFVGALVCIQLGFTNLVLSVIVDAASHAREDDKAFKARMEKQQQRATKERLLAQFQNMDIDGTGVLSISEFIRGYESDADLQEMFKVLRIGRSNIEEVFGLVDEDSSGSVNLEEFSNFVSQLQDDDPAVQTMLLRFQSNALLTKLSALQDAVEMLLSPEHTSPAFPRNLFRTAEPEQDERANMRPPGSWQEEAGALVAHDSRSAIISALGAKKADDYATSGAIACSIHSISSDHNGFDFLSKSRANEGMEQTDFLLRAPQETGAIVPHDPHPAIIAEEGKTVNDFAARAADTGNTHATFNGFDFHSRSRTSEELVERLASMATTKECLVQKMHQAVIKAGRNPDQPVEPREPPRGPKVVQENIAWHIAKL